MKALVPTGQSRALVALADTGVPEPPAAAVTRYIDAVRDGDSSAIRECFAEDTDTQHAAHVLFGQP
jgi:hypothetical protein